MGWLIAQKMVFVYHNCSYLLAAGYYAKIHKIYHMSVAVVAGHPQGDAPTMMTRRLIATVVFVGASPCGCPAHKSLVHSYVEDYFNAIEKL